MSSKAINEKYGNKIRLRASGLLFKNRKILLLKHLGIGENGFYWLPPGGGVEDNEKLIQTVEREFLEEVNLKIKTKQLVSVEEFIKFPLHAIEFYFKVELLEKLPINIEIGHDPEIESKKSFSEVKWFDKSQLSEIKNNCPEFLFELDFND